MTGEDQNEVKELREAFDLSVVEMAKNLGVHRATLSRWEAKGLPKNGTAKTAIKALRAKLKELKNGTS